MASKSFRELLLRDEPLILIGAHDALSARLIEQAGFEAYMIGGFPAVGARYGVPDIGLKGLGEISAAVQERMHRETFIWARTDARGPLGLDEALRRAERYLRAGADGIFVEAPRSV